VNQTKIIVFFLQVREYNNASNLAQTLDFISIDKMNL